VACGPRYGAAVLAVQVPEPSALALIGVGLLGLTAVRGWAWNSKSNG